MPRSLLPREHGAYAQLGAPLVAALIAFGISRAGLLLVLGACLAFVANEPLLVVLGHRGKRAKAEDGARARRWLAILAPAAAVAGAVGLVLAPAALPLAAAVGVAAGVLVAFAWRRAERTLAGELVAAIALTGAAAPVAAAAGASIEAAARAWAAWAIGYALTVVAVHRVIARHKQPATVVDAIAIACAVAVGAAAAYAGLHVALPLAATAIGVMIVAPSARHLRAIGFVLVGASVISTALLVHAHT